MEKKLALIFVIVFLAFSPVSNAQIGVSSNGKVLCFDWYHDFLKTPMDSYYWSSDPNRLSKYRIPVYRDGAKYCIKRKYNIVYNMADDTWVRKDEYMSIIQFDSLGLISRSNSEWSHDNDTLVIKILLNSTNWDGQFEYENGKIVKICDRRDCYFFRYDGTGKLNKVLFSNNIQYNISCSPQGTISKIRKYIDGREDKEYDYPHLFKYTQGGFTVTTSRPEKYPEQIYCQTDKQGNIIKWTKDCKYPERDYWGHPTGKTNRDIKTEYYENTYDQYGNLVRCLHYQMRDVGKFYIDGSECTYTYMFDDDIKKYVNESNLYEDVLAFYPNDAEIKHTDAKDLIVFGDSLRNKRQYVEAKGKYMEALQLTPNDKLIQMRLTSIEEDIAEAERQRKEAEKRARRTAEEQQVRRLVDLNVMWANNKIKQWNLEEAVGLLQQAIDTAKAHSYDYRISEMNLRVDSIQRIQASFADASRSFDYKYYRPDLWETTNNALSLKIKSFLHENEKTIKRNKLSLSLYTYQEGSSQLGEASKPLTKLSQELLKTEHLPNFVIDNEPRKGKATFDYSIEYAKGTVKVYRNNGSVSVTPKFAVSTHLETDIYRMFTSVLYDLPSSCDGDYKYDVTSIDINGQTEYSVLLKGCSFRNGPQNAWKSLLVPGWGDMYVEDEGTFAWWKTALSYGFVGLGVSFLTSVLKFETKTSKLVYDSIWVDASSYSFYASQGITGWWEQTNPHQEDRVTNHSSTVGAAFVAIGAAVWIGDVIYVWIKGAENKKSNAERLGRISYTYDVARDIPVLNYTLRF